MWNVVDHCGIVFVYNWGLFRIKAFPEARSKDGSLMFDHPSILKYLKDFEVK